MLLHWNGTGWTAQMSTATVSLHSVWASGPDENPFDHSFTKESRDTVCKTYEAWKRLRLKVLQDPTDMDFGFTFVVQDPDGHRLRPFVLTDNPR